MEMTIVLDLSKKSGKDRLVYLQNVHMVLIWVGASRFHRCCVDHNQLQKRKLHLDRFPAKSTYYRFSSKSKGRFADINSLEFPLGWQLLCENYD